MPVALSSLTSQDAALLALRPLIPDQPAYSPPQTVGEFLHHTLRPVLKLQNQLLLITVADYLRDHHVPLATKSNTEQQRVLAEVLVRNGMLRHTLIGLVVGLFTSAELAVYRQHRAELNRRILEMATRRLQDQLPALYQAYLTEE